jgi:hypothetical protein
MSALPLPDFSHEFAGLTPAQQTRVLGFIRELKKENESDADYRERRRKALLEIAGSITPEDAKLMRKAIEEDCERIDVDGW